VLDFSNTLLRNRRKLGGSYRYNLKSRRTYLQTEKESGKRKSLRICGKWENSEAAGENKKVKQPRGRANG
jgi:hypothetical protein